MKKSVFLTTFFLTFLAANAQKVSGSKMTWGQLYPILKNNLLESTCEPSVIFEENANSISVNSVEADYFLSSWEWDFGNRPLLIKDIDNDGLVDYTIEMTNAGGGCGGEIGEDQRWTLFGSDPNYFIYTHYIPYESETGNWESLEIEDNSIGAWEELYPILLISLLESTCEPSVLSEETENSISVNSQESDNFLSSWEWDLVNRPLIIEDIDNDGLVDYTIEMSNAGGGCGGQIGEEERWTLFGSYPTNFIFTHYIPYESETGDWVEH